MTEHTPPRRRPRPRHATDRGGAATHPTRTTPAVPAGEPVPAPDPLGDVVPGDPPVPITVWHLPGADSEPAALVITAWPAGPVAAADHLNACAAPLARGGCVAVVVTSTQTPDHLGPLVVVGRAAGLTYLQHIVVAHHLGGRTPDAGAAGAGMSRSGGRRLRVHTDLLILRRPGGAGD